MPINLMYHDVTSAGSEDSSGFPGPEAARYKLTPGEFFEHLDAIGSVAITPAHIGSIAPDHEWRITFDDGGVSAVTIIANELESRNWRGWFFITTDLIGLPGFLTQDQIRDLHQRGHVIGSHTCSHPERFSQCTISKMEYEWSRSCQILAEIVNGPITTGSVPGGFFSADVARTAASSGIKMLFNSEPTNVESQVDGCRVIGRYTVYRGMSAYDASLLLTSPVRRWRQAAFWSAKKAAKSMAGPIYKVVRKRLLHQAYAH